MRTVGRLKTVVDCDGPIAAFAAELRKMRLKADSPTYREMAGVTKCGHTGLSEADRAARFPTWNRTMAYLRGCGVSDKEIHLKWRKKWLKAKRAIDRKAEADRAPSRRKVA